MAIVNEDVRMVKLLLDYGANVHERSLGCFWVPDDQKDKTNVTLRQLLTQNKTLTTTTSHETDKISEQILSNNEIDNFDLSCNHFSNTQLTTYNGYVAR